MRSLINTPFFKGLTSGFTLIEVIVVITLVSLMLFFAVPRFQHLLQQNDSTTVSRWTMLNVKLLKEKSVRENRLYILHVDMDANCMWVTDENMTEENLQDAKDKSYCLPGNMRLLDVMFSDGNHISTGTAQIRFYKKGYSDYAMIHFENEDQQKLSCLIEPFMPTASWHEKYLGMGN